MNINDEYKKVGWVVVGFCLLGIMFYTGPGPFSCDRIAKQFKTTFECNLVLDHIESNTGTAELYGTDMLTKKDTMIEEHTKWIITNMSEFARGDTIRKERGKYTIYIKRKGKSITIPYHCDRVYPDTAQFGKSLTHNR